MKRAHNERMRATTTHTPDIIWPDVRRASASASETNTHLQKRIHRNWHGARAGTGQTTPGAQSDIKRPGTGVHVYTAAAAAIQRLGTKIGKKKLINESEYKMFAPVCFSLSSNTDTHTHTLTRARSFTTHRRTQVHKI